MGCVSGRTSNVTCLEDPLDVRGTASDDALVVWERSAERSVDVKDKRTGAVSVSELDNRPCFSTSERVDGSACFFSDIFFLGE